MSMSMAAISTCISSKMSIFQYFQLSFLFGTYKKKEKIFLFHFDTSVHNSLDEIKCNGT